MVSGKGSLHINLSCSPAGLAGTLTRLFCPADFSSQPALLSCPVKKEMDRSCWKSYLYSSTLRGQEVETNVALEASHLAVVVLQYYS